MSRIPRKTYAQKPSVRYDGIILKLKKGGANQAVLTVFTKQQGWLRLFVPKGKKAANQGSGSFFPLNRITFDAWEKNDSLSMGEYESRGHVLMADFAFEDYVYTQLFIEMVMALVPEHEVDVSIYQLVCRYAAAIEQKDTRIATIIAGWQLIALAGFCPDVRNVRVYRDGVDEYGNTRYSLFDDEQPVLYPVELTEPSRLLWQQLLAYDWDKPEEIKINVHHLSILEQLLYQYVCQCSDKPLKTLELLQTTQK